MKKLLKISAFLAAMMLVLTFVACSSDDDDEPSVVTTWTSEETMTLRFFDDNSFEVTMDGQGTYTGDTTKDGTIKATITHMAGADGKLQALGDNAIPTDAKIENETIFMQLDEDSAVTFTKK